MTASDTTRFPNKGVTMNPSDPRYETYLKHPLCELLIDRDEMEPQHAVFYLYTMVRDFQNGVDLEDILDEFDVDEGWRDVFLELVNIT
jgi:hypothetical protein